MPTFPVIGDHQPHNIYPLITQFSIFRLSFKYNLPSSFQKDFFHILLAIQPFIAAYQHHTNSSIQCPDVVSFCPFKPPTTTLCLHFSIKSSISIPPALSPSCLFILLLAGDINPNPGPSNCLNVTYANIRSINKKYPAITKFIFDNDTDLFAMSETWIRPDITSANLSGITPQGYNFYQQPREGRRGGGLGFFVKDGLDSSVVPTKTCTIFENYLIKISLHKESFYSLNIYRPPSSSISAFFEQFQSLLEDIHHNTENLEIIGDFNFHIESTSSNSKAFNSLIDSFDLTQKVNFPTLLMPFLTITCTLHLPTPRSQLNATVSFRNYHKINKEKMKTDLISSDLISSLSNDSDTLYKQYHTTLTTLILKHAPLHTKHTKVKYIPGWVNDAVIAARDQASI